jgi:hypothetical protein
VSDALPLKLIAAAPTSARDRLSEPLADRLNLPAVDSTKTIESEALPKKDATLTTLSESVNVSDALTPITTMKLVASEKVIESDALVE